MIKLAILASGGGSNAEAIINYFNQHSSIVVELVISNKKDAYVLNRAQNHNIAFSYIPNSEFKTGDKVFELLKSYEVDYVILAGFLLLIPQLLTKQFPNKIINIHPALLPQYGGKGMYGSKVHQAVFNNFENESGMTIHLVNEKYDDGKILFQEKVQLDPVDTPDVIAKKVLKLEHQHYPRVIEDYILQFDKT